MNEQFDNVSVSLRANIYHDSRVSNRNVPSGWNKETLGVILPNSYNFGVGDREIVTIIRGSAEVLLLPEKKEWIKVLERVNFSIIA